MTRYIRLIAKATAAAFLLVLTGASAALAGPAPIEPEFPPPASTPTEVATADGFPWMLTSSIALLVIAVVALSVVLWQRHRTHTVHHRLVTP